MKICPKCQRTYPDEFSLCPRDGTALTAQATETEAQLAAGLSRRFRIVRRLGQGGMGAVFLADQITVGNRPVALKVLNRKLLDDPDFLMRFQNEAASTGRIRHSNVVTIYESGQADDGTPYIAMEFLEGESLAEALKRRGALPVPEVAEILQQAARGLNAANKLGIIHRDLKPDNIFLTYPDDDSVAPVSPTASAPVSPPAPAVALASPPAQEEGAVAPTSPPATIQVKIVDFGIAKLRESGMHTQTGTVLGTPAYMSFEQASGMRSDELDARSDVYSLGVVVYEMLTGRTPFQSDTPVGYLRMHMQEDPPPFRTVKPDLPALPQLESVVMKALAKDRNQRYSSVLEFARELTSAAQPSPAAQSPVTIPPTRIVPVPVLAKPRHIPVVTERPSWVKHVVFGLLLLIVIAGGIWYFSQPAPQPAPNAPGRPSETAKSQEAPVVRVPFVGCSSDGQTGPVPAPKGDEKVVQIDARAAQRLAYYEAADYGVLAPRGWYCFGTYGSNASNLYVAPEPIKGDDLFSTTWGGFTGPAIQASEISGETSGRLEVARVIARVFPAQKAFVQSVIKEGIEPASGFPFGPYPNDKLIFQSDRIVEYQSPPLSEGLGTISSLRANDYPINVVAILQGQAPDLLLLTVRLPPDMNDLTSHIIQQIERDNAASLPGK